MDVFCTSTKNEAEKGFLFLSDMKFSFLKRLVSTIEEDFPGSVDYLILSPNSRIKQNKQETNKLFSVF
jgi:hypothetical protein